MKKLLRFIVNECILKLILLLSFSVIQHAGAQEIVAAGGGTYSGTSVQLSWTIGEPVIETFSSGNITLTQGFHQSNLTVTALDIVASYGLLFKVYPNPAPDLLVIEKITGSSNGISMMLYDINGRLLLERVMKNDVETLNMEVYRQGEYLLKIWSATNLPVQSFKIIKN